MKVSAKTPIVRIRVEVLVSAWDQDEAIQEFHDLFLNSDTAQFREFGPAVVERVEEASEDCITTLYPETFDEEVEE